MTYIIFVILYGFRLESNFNASSYTLLIYITSQTERVKQQLWQTKATGMNTGKSSTKPLMCFKCIEICYFSSFKSKSGQWVNGFGVLREYRQYWPQCQDTAGSGQAQSVAVENMSGQRSSDSMYYLMSSCRTSDLISL